jgi:hypothetical protein
VTEDHDLHFGGCGVGIAPRWSDDFETHRAERDLARSPSPSPSPNSHSAGTALSVCMREHKRGVCRADGHGWCST